MTLDARVIDDLMRVASGALGTAAGLRDEARMRMRDRFERTLARMDVVTREEFEVVRGLAATARAEQEAMAARLDALEAQLARLQTGAVAPAGAESPGPRRRRKAAAAAPETTSATPEAPAPRRRTRKSG